MKANNNVIRQYTGENAPNSVMNAVTAVASHILIVPLALISDVLGVLNNRFIPYNTYYRKNDIIIAILMKGDN